MSTANEFTGHVRSAWRHKDGFVFVQPSDGGDQVFLHASDFVGEWDSLTLNDRIAFQIATKTSGRKRCIGARKVTSAE